MSIKYSAIDRYGLTELDELIESKSVDTTIFSVETAVQKVQAIQNLFSHKIESFR